MAEAANPDLAAYPTFNEFFTRPLKPGARPLADKALVCPVDGAISQVGAIKKDQIFRQGPPLFDPCAGRGDAELAAEFEDGTFATIYLSPDKITTAFTCLAMVV